MYRSRQRDAQPYDPSRAASSRPTAVRDSALPRRHRPLAVKTATVPTPATSTPSAAHNQKRERSPTIIDLAANDRQPDRQAFPFGQRVTCALRE